MIKVSSTGMAVSLITDLRFPTPGQQGHGRRIIQLAAKSEISIRYELYNKFIDAVKNTFETSDYNHIYIKWDGDIYTCSWSRIENYKELNDAYYALYPQESYDVYIYFDNNGKVAALIPYDMIKTSSKGATINELVYKEEGYEKIKESVIEFDSIKESVIDYAHEIPGVKEWYYWSEGIHYE